MTFADTISMTVLSPIFGASAVYAVRNGKIDWFYGYVWRRFYCYRPITEDDDFLAFWGCVLLYAALCAASGYFAFLGWTGAPAFAS